MLVSTGNRQFRPKRQLLRRMVVQGRHVMRYRRRSRCGARRLPPLQIVSVSGEAKRQVVVAKRPAARNQTHVHG